MPLPSLSPAVAGMVAYSVPRHPAPLDLLLDGIGGLPSPPDLFARLSDADPDALVRSYPDTRMLSDRLADQLGLPRDRVLVTAGGDDALDRSCRAYLSPGRSIVLPVPTFEMIPRYARWAGATIREVPWPGGDWPFDAVLAAVDATTSLVAVVSPNNPTGQVITAERLRALSAALPDVLLLVDLAYVEFADHDLTSVVAELPNAVAFRTFSKAWGLAGLRVGYAIGAAEVIAALRVAGNPYPVSGPSLHLAAKRLDHDQAVSAAYVASVRAERDGMTDLLRTLGVDAQRSQANFVFARTPRADWLRDGMAGLGIGVRGWPGHESLADAVRINIPGDAPTTARLHHAVRAVLQPDALLFDVDGVLVDVSSSYREAIRQTAAHFGVTLGPDDIAAAKARGGANNDWVLTRALLASHGVDVSLDAVVEVFERLYQGHGDAPGLKTTEQARFTLDELQRLRARLPLALVTGRPLRDASELVEREGWRGLFDAMVVMGETAPKPDPAPVRAALERLGVRTAWMVGDTVDDVRAARAAGVVPLGMVAPGEAPGRGGPLLLKAGAARIIASAPELESLLP